ncbi:uncharacterized protein LOC117644431 [Thrips palmi]|uniref:Kinetochore protein Spc24 n=1 Tax=Thrips palmi TaxID=161013 RepID=A0A6P8YR54_THRPL|nr:uncharacterized protein LOC117644431 [Thrips palmi]
MGTIEDIVSSIVIPPSCNHNLDETVDVHNEMTKVIKKTGVLTNKLQGDMKSLKDKLSSLEKERAQARKDVIKMKEDNTAVSTKIAKLKSEIKDVQYKINKINQKSSITQKEKEILKQNEEELHAYKAFTGIRWNFNAPDNVVEGIITNSKTNFVKVFQFEKSMPNKKIRNSLWCLIGEAGSASWHNMDENKENQLK